MLINITIPVFNEETILRENVAQIFSFCKNNLLDDWFVVMADNASTDKTAKISKEIIARQEANGQTSPRQIKYLFLSKKGKGLAIKEAWQKFSADYYIFMDADLATDLEALPRLIKELKNGADIVIGSRYLPESKNKRSVLRKIISKIYRFLSRLWLGLSFSDLPCGFKGVNHRVVMKTLPNVKNNEWFFDTELLYRAHKNGYKIKETPVVWTETPNQKRKSKVGIIKVGLTYLKSLMEIKRD